MRLIVCGIILLFFNQAYSQVIELTGAIIVGKSEMMGYRISYQLDAKNQLSGYSIGDLFGENETRASISGTYDPGKKTLQFRETKILSSKIKLPDQDFCLMEVKGKFEKKSGKYIFQGTFTSSAANKQLICESGTLVMTTTQNIYEMAVKAAKVIDKVKLPDTLGRELTAQLAPLKGVDKVKTIAPGSLTEYKLTKDEIRLDILDDRLEDGDKITILKNKTTLVSGLVTANEVKTYTFEVSEDEQAVVFTFIADNEGYSPPNTLKVVLTHGKTKDLLIAQLKKGQYVKVMLKR